MSQPASQGETIPFQANLLRKQLLPSVRTAGKDGDPLDEAQRIEFVQQLLGRHVARYLGIYRLPDHFLLSVVIPVFNEEATIEEVIRRVRNTQIPCEIIVVNDGSTDGTRDRLERLRGQSDLIVEHFPTNQGKGAALKRGFSLARGAVVLVQDADLEYNPDDYWRLLEPIVAGDADVVYGSRMTGSPQRFLCYWHYLGNRILTVLSNLRTNLYLSDMETCYKVFRREILQAISPTLQEPRFGIEPELTAKIAKIPGVRVFEMPIAYSGRTYTQGKKIHWRDGLWAIWCTLKY